MSKKRESPLRLSILFASLPFLLSFPSGTTSIWYFATSIPTAATNALCKENFVSLIVSCYSDGILLTESRPVILFRVRFVKITIITVISERRKS